MAPVTLTDASSDSRPPVAAELASPIRRAAWELSGLCIALMACFVAVSLCLDQKSSWNTGVVGAAVSDALRLLLGRYVAFAVPAGLLVLGVHVFLARRFPWSVARAVGVFLLLPAAAGLLALPYADDPEMRRESFAQAGALGTFMVEWYGLRLVGNFGVIGAAMVLVGLGLVGIVMATHQPVTALCLAVAGHLRRRQTTAAEAVEPVMAVGTLPTATIPAPTHDPESGDVDPVELLEERLLQSQTAAGTGIFGRGRRTAVLSEPQPDEMADPDSDDTHAPGGYDADVQAAARALELARVDEEFARAVAEEADHRPPSMPGIIIRDAEPPLDFLDGNPADMAAAPAPPPPPSTANTTVAPARPVMGDGLARLFPERWNSGPAGAERKPRPANDKPHADVLDAAEQRQMQRLAAPAPPRATAPAVEEPIDDEAMATDPLFTEGLDTRPAGAAAALAAASVSAIEKEESLAARRSRMMLDYRLPTINLLDDPPRVDHRMSREKILEISDMLEKTFADFNIEVKVTEVTQGPVVTRFELRPAPGVKVSRIVGLEHDIALAMRAERVRIEAPIPGKAAVGIEIPNETRAGVYFKELVGCTDFWNHPSPLAMALGKTIDGRPYFTDLKKMPHLLIAGATGAGKSVCLNTIICSFLYRQRPDRLRLLLVDPKRVELSIYADIPHLISPVICEPKAAAAALHWAVGQMEERYKTLVEFKVRNIDGYNEIALEPEKHPRFRGRTIEPMPHMVVVVDELADLMVVAKNEVEESIQRLAQMARAVGIHLILATQRPSVDVITGIIKANFPTRVAFQVRQKVDSRTILDQGGAEALLGRGDMLYAPAGAGKPIRVQGAFLSDEEVLRIVEHCKAHAEPMYDVEEFEPLLSEKEKKELAKLMGAPESMEDLDAQDRVVRGTNKTMGKVSAGLFVPHEGGSAGAEDDEIDEALVRAAARVILEGRKGSTSLVQRRLKVGFARAGRLMDMLEERGIVGPYKGSKPREILVDCDAALAQLDLLEQQINTNGGDSRSAALILDGDDNESVEDEGEDSPPWDR